MTNRREHRWCPRRRRIETRTHGALSKTKSPAIDKTLRRLSSGAGRRVLNKRPIFVLRCRRLQFKLKRKCIIPRQSGASLRPRPGVKSTKIAKQCTYIYAYRYAEFAGCTRRDDTRPEFTPLMYVLGGDRSLSHELLIVRRHNSPRVSHPLSVSLLPPAFTTTTITTARSSSLISALYKRVRNTRLYAFAGSDERVCTIARRVYREVFRTLHFSIG